MQISILEMRHRWSSSTAQKILCLCLLFSAQWGVGSHASFFPKKSTKVNLENQLPQPSPSDVKEVEQRAFCPLRFCCFFFVQGTNKVSQIPPPHSPTVGTLAPGGAATRQRAWTAQSLIQTAPCIRGGSGLAQCLGILL